MIADLTLLVENENFRSASGTDLICDMIAGIFQHGKTDFMFSGISGDFGKGILLIGHDCIKGDSLAGKLIGQFLQASAIQLRQRAFRSQKRDHDQLLLSLIVQLDGFASEILQSEVLHLLTQQSLLRFG